MAFPLFLFNQTKCFSEKGTMMNTDDFIHSEMAEKSVMENQLNIAVAFREKSKVNSRAISSPSTEIN